jgi:hypothetical protein
MYNVTKSNKKLNKNLVTKRYLPDRLSKTDRIKQAKMLKKSRKLYKKGIYYSRKMVKSYKSKKSNHIRNAERIYKIDSLAINNELERKTGCAADSLKKIVNKGEGAYFSSGSRPNQTAQSWGVARLASAITGGKAAAVDFNILEQGCSAKSRALKFAKEARKKYGFGKHRVPKTSL